MFNKNSQLQEEKKKLFSHADGNLAIKQMKNLKSHLHDSRDLLLKSLDQLSTINEGLANTSANL